MAEVGSRSILVDSPSPPQVPIEVSLPPTLRELATRQQRLEVERLQIKKEMKTPSKTSAEIVEAKFAIKTKANLHQRERRPRREAHQEKKNIREEKRKKERDRKKEIRKRAKKEREKKRVTWLPLVGL